MAGLRTNGVKTLEAKDLCGNDNDRNNDGTYILSNIEAFLHAKHCDAERVNMVIGLLEGVFKKSVLWKPKTASAF